MGSLRLIVSRETPSVLSIRTFCTKCMTLTYMVQMKPMTDTHKLKCETCGYEQITSTDEERNQCIAENTFIKNARRKK